MEGTRGHAIRKGESCPHRLIGEEGYISLIKVGTVNHEKPGMEGPYETLLSVVSTHAYSSIYEKSGFEKISSIFSSTKETKQ